MRCCRNLLLAVSPLQIVLHGLAMQGFEIYIYRFFFESPRVLHWFAQSNTWHEHFKTAIMQWTSSQAEAPPLDVPEPSGEPPVEHIDDSCPKAIYICRKTINVLTVLEHVVGHWTTLFWTLGPVCPLEDESGEEGNVWPTWPTWDTWHVNNYIYILHFLPFVV